MCSLRIHVPICPRQLFAPSNDPSSPMLVPEMHVILVDGTIWAIMHLDDSKAPSCNEMDLWGSRVGYWLHVLSYSGHEMRCGSLLIVIMITLLIPIGSAECERAFSLINRMKTSLRNWLCHEESRGQMAVTWLGPHEIPLLNMLIPKFIPGWIRTTPAATSPG